MRFPYICESGCLILWPQINKTLVLFFHRNIRKDWPPQLKGLSNPVAFLRQLLKANAWNEASTGWHFSHVFYQFPATCSTGPEGVCLYLIPPQGFSTYDFIQAFLEARQASSFHNILRITWRKVTWLPLIPCFAFSERSEESFPIHFHASCFALKVFSL